ncbi:transcriptional regulator [Limosilactobacillus fermentum]|uniref:transcriptional regulator n=1 Tax=Bacteria TaxID=2 RepID=UPI00189A1DB9|nr:MULTISPECIES: transcriptional regulator [Lactobacillus]MCZ3806260.1 transcriptional regulator [Lactobacillus gasseri]MCZ3807966.1 transcriptional regulator [Lactobacillus gasseri]MCZ3811345.1 transcriptional regulator [Lactobacillus gasseri]MCZ3813063.1 transcriptional regulator [Lactobacillus gasseri]MCZ3814784.1 transcriptional regulator [Lactobacillus gasseri]
MLTEKILSTLSCQRFLTLNEICKATNIDHLIGQQQLKKLEKDRLIERRFFAGRSYFKLTDVTKSTSDLGKKTWDKLSQRKLAIQIGQARTCYHHLAGQAGVQLFQWLNQNHLVERLSLDNYVLTAQGKRQFSHFLVESVQQTRLQTCIDFSERLPHLSGALGTRLLSQLVKNDVVALTSKRQIRINIPLARWFKEDFLEDKSNQMFMG